MQVEKQAELRNAECRVTAVEAMATASSELLAPSSTATEDICSEARNGDPVCLQGAEAALASTVEREVVGALLDATEDYSVDNRYKADYVLLIWDVNCTFSKLILHYIANPWLQTVRCCSSYRSQGSIILVYCTS